MTRRLLDGRLAQREPDFQRYCANRIHFFAEPNQNPDDQGNQNTGDDPDDLDDPGKTGGGVGGKTNPNPDDQGAGDGGDNDLLDGEKIDPVKVKALAEDRNRKNRKLIAAEKRIVALEAAKKKLDEKDLSEKEKLELTVKEQKDEIDRMKLDASKGKCITDAVEAGVLGKYADIAAEKFRSAQKEDGDFDAKGFWKDFKKENPELFGAKTPPLKTGGGGSAGQFKQKASTEYLKKIQAEYDTERFSMNSIQRNKLISEIVKVRRELEQ